MSIALDEDCDSGLLQPLANKSIVDRIIDRLTKAILERKLRPGQKIPTEIELCESMQVGRNSVREAIKVLVTMGVLVIKRSEGTFVTEGFSERMLDPMIYGLILEGGDSHAMIELRWMFEDGVMRTAIHKRTDEELNALRDALEGMRLATVENATEQRLIGEDFKFHHVLVRMVKNPLVFKISLIIERLTMPSRMKELRYYIEKGGLDAYLQRHAEMIRVVSERDLAAVDQVLYDHFTTAEAAEREDEPSADR